MNVSLVDFKAQYQAYKSEFDEAVLRVMASGWYIGGPEVQNIEKLLMEYTGAKRAIACANGTEALQLALMAIDIQPGDEVITSPFTFIASAEAIALLGAKAVFADIDPDTFQIDADCVERAVTKKTKAIIPVSLFGQTSDMDALNKIAAAKNITLIEDAAQSFGADYKGKKSCNLSRISTTSFFPTKPLGCLGDGGMMFTSDDSIADKLLCLRDHGQTKKYVHSVIGVNSRLDAMQAALLSVKFKYLQKELERRNEIAKSYKSKITNSNVRFQKLPDDQSSVWAQFSIRHSKRDNLIAALLAKSVSCAVHYPVPVYAQPAFEKSNHGSFPACDLVSKEIMSLPMHPFLTDEQVQYTVDCVNELA